MVVLWDFMGKTIGKWWFNGDLMGYDGDSMGYNGDLMGYNGI